MLTVTVDWQQVGDDIDGTEVGHLFGETVALSDDGRTLAVRQYEVNGDALVDVQVYQLSDTAGWVKSGGLINAGTSDDTGWAALAISGDGQTLIIGANTTIHGGVEVGEVRVFEQASENDEWSLIGSVLTGSQENEFFGSSVAISDDGQIIAVGATQLSSFATGTGHVRIYQRSEGDQWVPFGNEIEGTAGGDLFGGSVALTADGHTLAVGAMNADLGQTNTGSASVYRFNTSTQLWTPVGNTISGQDREQSARAVAISEEGETVAVTTNEGARVYRLTNNEWQLIGEELTGEQGSRAQTVALSAGGQRVAIGMPFFLSESTGGLVRSFKFDSAIGAWQQSGPDIFGEAAGDRSGAGLAISADGQTIAIGAYGNDDGGDRAGHVRVLTARRTQLAFDTPPEITAPTGTVSDTTVVAKWLAVDGAESYQLWLSDRNQNLRVLHRLQITDTEYDLSEQQDGQYRLWVRAVDCEGRTTGWSKKSDFTINRSRQPDSLLASTALNQSTRTLQWQTTETVDSHWLWINRPDGTVVVNQQGLPNATADLSALPAGEYTAWLSFNVQGAQSEWVRFEFEIASQAPLRPVIVSPSTNETDGNVEFQWTSDDQTHRYELQLNYEGYGRIIHETNVSGSSYRPPTPLLPGQWKFWVRSFNANGESSLWSRPLELTVANPHPGTFDPTPAQPIIFFHDDGNLSWSGVERATHYEIWISEATSNRIVLNENLDGLQFTFNLDSGQYRVWLRTIDGFGFKSRWSRPVSFRVEE